MFNLPIFGGLMLYHDTLEIESVTLYNVAFPLFLITAYFIADWFCIISKSEGHDVNKIDAVDEEVVELPPVVVVVDEDDEVQFPGVPAWLGQVFPELQLVIEPHAPELHTEYVTLVIHMLVPVPSSVLLW